MRSFAPTLATVITLASLPAAAAVSGDTPPIATVIAYNTCPVYEGYPDCHPDADVGAFARPPSPRVRTAGSEFQRPFHRRLAPLPSATARLRLAQ